MANTLAQDLSEALPKLSSGASLRDGATALLEALGYTSHKTAHAGTVDEFLGRFAPGDRLTAKQRKLLEPWSAVEIVFQFSTDEIKKQTMLFEVSGFNDQRIESFLFLAVEIPGGTWPRTHLAETTRIVNSLFKMPVILLFRHGKTLTLATIHRRTHKRDNERDVLERVTLVKDIRTDIPHRAHIDILSDLSFHKMLEAGVRSFDQLHAFWEQTLDIETLNKRFYRELFNWFQRATKACRFPDDGAGYGGSERHIIRLITRLLFIWFLKEKELVPRVLFEDKFANTALKSHSPDSTDYYKAILQNLFFATLNTETLERSFDQKHQHPNQEFSKFRYHDLLTDPNRFVELLKQVPFVNGGLFDCLDDFPKTSAYRRYIDAFTDEVSQHQQLNVPAHLFLDHKDGLFPLFRHYKFTIEENTPLDQEVALDPELLGRVFENLLAAYNPETRQTARKSTGSYYTPREVVDYMVREALTDALAKNRSPADEDTEFWRERLRYLLDHSDAMNDASDLFDENERRILVEAIAKIRTLDPAVGSGAFPMGILQTLTLALRRLDPDNLLWEEIQKRRTKDKFGDSYDDSIRRSRNSVLDEISATFERYRQSDFGRKLYLIQNCIYGVDKQPIACQISKLRFFISLVIEQTLDNSAPNLGIKPLPNLETRFVAANTLIALNTQSQSLLLSDDVASKQREIEEIRELYFLADSRPDKLKYVERDYMLRDQLRELLEGIGRDWITERTRSIEINAKKLRHPEMRDVFRAREFKKLEKQQYNYDAHLQEAKMVAKWDPFDQNAHAEWFDSRWMFGVSNEFDVVIGNPPYIQLQKDGGSAGKLYSTSGYQTFAKKGDIYQLFYERGCKLLRPTSGVLAYITSNSWLKAEYGKSLRRWLADNHTPLRLIELGKDVFENAIVDSAVLIIRHGKDRPVECKAIDVDQTSNQMFLPREQDWKIVTPDGDRPWMALSRIERSVIEKMEAVGIPLKHWDISIYYGIKTGYNRAFIVDQATRDAIVDLDPKSAKILKRVLRGRDIGRYHTRWANQWLIATFPSLGLDIDAYPGIKSYLLSFGKERLAQDGLQLPSGVRSRSRTPNAWYELQTNCAYHANLS